MAEKYTLFLKSPKVDKTMDFLNYAGIEDSKFVLKRLVEYMDFPDFFSAYFNDLDFPIEQEYELRTIIPKKKRKMGVIDFEANIVFPKKFEDINGAITSNYVFANLESKLLDKSIGVRIYKEKKKNKFSLTRTIQ